MANYKDIKVVKLKVTLQHAVVSIELNIVTNVLYASEKFIRDNVVASFSLFSVVIPPQSHLLRVCSVLSSV